MNDFDKKQGDFLDMNKKGRSAALAASKQVIIKAGTRLLIDRESIAR